jgi:protein-S-isoprenylcysteine O-methyltransferase Ste14
MALIFACALIVAFFLLEGRLRADDRARSFKRGPHDKQSTTYLFRAFYVMGAALVAGGVLTAKGIAALPGPGWLAWLGTALTAAGIWLRLYANHILGPYFTRTLKVKSGQPVVQRGPYRVIRHPGYLGIISMWVGGGLATRNALALAFVTLLVVSVYVYRIRTEEAMLARSIAGYRKYQARTWRLVPFVY